MASEYKQGFWKEHSSAWKSSGLTQQAYCEQQDISFQSFAYQHHRISNKAKRPTANFVEAKPESHHTNSHAPGLQLMFPNGVRIGISGDLNPVILQTVLTIAGELPC